MASADPAAAAPRAEADARALDWIDLLYIRAPLPPWGVGLLIALAMLTLFGVLTSASGELSDFLTRGGLGVEADARQGQPGRPLTADPTRQAHRPARARHQPHRHLGELKDGILRRHHPPCEGRELDAGADAGPV